MEAKHNEHFSEILYVYYSVHSPKTASVKKTKGHMQRIVLVKCPSILTYSHQWNRLPHAV
jgi:hypothetical protein